MKGAFFYVDAGMGHYTPATALADTFKEMGNEAEVLNLLVTCNSPFWNWYCKKSWRFQLHHPRFEYIQHSFWDTKISEVLMTLVVRLHHGMGVSFLAWYRKEKPDFLLCTNFLGGVVLPTLVKKYHLPVPVYIYAADAFNNPISGTNRNIDILYVPTILGRENCIRNGQLPLQVRVCPFPLKADLQKFTPMDKYAARMKLGLEPDKFTILLNLGGEGIGDTSFVQEVCKLGLDWQIVVLGKLSITTSAKYNTFVKHHPDFHLSRPGFVHNMGEYICACDVQVGKAGANSLMESLYLKRPFMISELLYAALSTKDFFAKHHVGWVENNVKKQVETLKAYSENNSQQQVMANNLQHLPLQFDTEAFCRELIEETIFLQKEKNQEIKSQEAPSRIYSR